MAVAGVVTQTSASGPSLFTVVTLQSKGQGNRRWANKAPSAYIARKVRQANRTPTSTNNQQKGRYKYPTTGHKNTRKRHTQISTVPSNSRHKRFDLGLRAPRHSTVPAVKIIINVIQNTLHQPPPSRTRQDFG